VGRLLGVGVDLNIHNAGDVMTALHLAAGAGHYGILSSLLLGSAGKDAVDNFGVAPLLGSVWDRNLPVVRHLVEAGADLNFHATTSGKTSSPLVGETNVTSRHSTGDILHTPLAWPEPKACRKPSSCTVVGSGRDGRRRQWRYSREQPRLFSGR